MKQSVIKEKLSKVKNLSMTTDAWKSLAKVSYITVTAHMINDNVLESFCLDNSEITVRHTSENLLAHIEKVISDYGLEHLSEVTVNYNSADPNDIFAEDVVEEDEVDYLDFLADSEDEEETGRDRNNNLQFSNLDDDLTQISQDLVSEPGYMHPDSDQSPFGCARCQSNANNRVNITFISDNASDISKALRVNGKFKWFGCAGHHLNLVVKEGFKKVEAAARLLKKCKEIVKVVNASLPLIYDITHRHSPGGYLASFHCN